MSRFSAIAAIALLFSPVPALADWENTRWGSSEADVIAAVEGSVRNQGDDDDRVWEQDQRVTRSGDYHGMAATWVFFFDEKDGLSVIKIKPVDFAQCEAFLKAAEADQGKPTKTERKEVASSSFDVKHFTNRDNNLAMLTLLLSGPGGRNPFCHITFQPYGNGVPGARN
jgi:hypothetical protein